MPEEESNPEQRKEDQALDKDINNKGLINKIVSTHTCCLLYRGPPSKGSQHLCTLIVAGAECASGRWCDIVERRVVSG